MKSFLEYINESKTPALPIDINKNYLKKSSVKSAVVDLEEDGERFDGRFWWGELPRNKGFSLLFNDHSGRETKVKSFKTEDDLNKAVSQIKKEMKMDDVFNMLR